MSEKKCKVYFATLETNEWDLSEWMDNIEFKFDQKSRLTHDEFLAEIKGCHGILIRPSLRIDKEALDVAGAQLKV